MNENQRKILDGALTAVLGVVIVWVFFSLFEGKLITDLVINDSENFKRYLVDMGVWSRLAYIGSVMLEVLIAFIPGWIIYPVGAAVFGFNQTVLLVMAGNFFGASISYWIGQRWGKPLLRKFIAAKYIARFDEYMEKRGSLSIFLLKLNPVTSFDLWNYLAGASPMPYWKFTAANLLGIFPLVLISTFLGEETFTLAPQVLGVLVLITILYAAWFILNLPRKIRRSKQG
jgi:uncharacterized membrane protein YdjX (TVP38/TMEM64 family)